MRALVVSNLGNPLNPDTGKQPLQVQIDYPAPSLSSEQVRIEVTAAGINFADTLLVQVNSTSQLLILRSLESASNAHEFPQAPSRFYSAVGAVPSQAQAALHSWLRSVRCHHRGRLSGQRAQPWRQGVNPAIITAAQVVLVRLFQKLADDVQGEEFLQRVHVYRLAPEA